MPVAVAGEGSAFVEFAPRHGDFAVAGIAARLVLGDDGACTSASAAACGVAAVPVDLSPALERLMGARTLDDASLREVAARVPGLFEPTSDLRASGHDRRQLVQLLSVEALRRAWTRAKEGS